MSQEIFQIIQNLNVEEFELQLVIQCAPVIAGEKASNLFITSEQNEKLLEQFLKTTGFCFYRFFHSNQKLTYLIFNRDELEKYLHQDDVRHILDQCGYKNKSIGAVLRTFQVRYQKYISNPNSFPHEMGVLLGYPVEDVKGFIDNNGKNYLYSGYWKVYENMEEKLKLFHRYEAVMNEQIKMLASGMTVDEIICFYKVEQSKDIMRVS